MTHKKKLIEVALPLDAGNKATPPEGFAEVVAMIQAARERALAAVNSELVDLPLLGG
jgi:hypothetical protein